MSRLGDYLLRQKVGGIVAAALAFACGAGLAFALRREPATHHVAAQPAFPARAEVSMSDTHVDAAEAEEDAVFDTGRYENYVYGYSVEIPDGMVGLGSTPPAPQHGFGIDLDNPRSTAWRRGPEFPKSYVYVDGSYNSLGWRRLDDVVESQLDFLREKGRGVSVQVRREARLGGRAAVRLVAHYEEGGVEMVSDSVFAFRDAAASVVYTVALSTPRSKYGRDRLVLEALSEGWCLQPVE